MGTMTLQVVQDDITGTEEELISFIESELDLIEEDLFSTTTWATEPRTEEKILDQIKFLESVLPIKEEEDLLLASTTESSSDVEPALTTLEGEVEYEEDIMVDGFIIEKASEDYDNVQLLVEEEVKVSEAPEITTIEPENVPEEEDRNTVTDPNSTIDMIMNVFDHFNLNMILGHDSEKDTDKDTDVESLIKETTPVEDVEVIEQVSSSTEKVQEESAFKFLLVI